MSQPVFQFDNYVVRPVEERERRYLTQLIEQDPYHVNQMDADFFLDLKPGEDAWALETLEQGRVVLYFKTQTAVRVSLLFSESETKEDKTRNRIALIKGMAWIEAQLTANSFREILFDSEGPELVQMAKRRMGFTEKTGDLVRLIPYAKGQKSRVDDWGTSPQAPESSGG
jgi:hypothetical protein